jgi:site-specific recombinase XerD
MAGSGVMSSLGAVLSDYLALRRALGCKLISAEGLLRQFVAHCDARGVTVVTSDVAVAWAMLPAGRSTAWWQTRLAAVRPFARWLQALEPATEVPALDAFGRVRSRRATPYIYSDDDVHALMQAASRLQRRLTRITYATLIGLLAATGMRSGEAIRLSRDDIDWKAGSLCVLNSKFGKSRMLMPVVPLAPRSQLPDQHGRSAADPLRRDGYLSQAPGMDWTRCGEGWCQAQAPRPEAHLRIEDAA